MRAMLISLLLSITIGNALYAMEDEDVNDGEITFMDAADSPQRSSDEFSQNGTSSSSNSPITVKTLNGMRELLTSCRRITGVEHGNDLPDQEKFEIPGHITIDSQVFVEYARRKCLIIKPEPGSCQRWICCSPKIKNQFGHVSFSVRKEWSEKILEVLFRLNDSTEITTQRGEDVEIVNDTVIDRISRTFSWASDENEQQGDNDSASEVDILRKRLKENKLNQKALATKAELDQELNEYLVKQQRSEESRSRWKERGFGVILAGIGIVVAYYVPNASC